MGEITVKIPNQFHATLDATRAEGQKLDSGRAIKDKDNSVTRHLDTRLIPTNRPY